MSTQLQNPTLHQSHPPSHFVRFYQDEVTLLSEVAEFIEQGLRTSGTAIVIATNDHIIALQDQLQGLASLNGEEQPLKHLIVLNAEDTLPLFMVDDWPDERLFDRTVGSVVRSACDSGTVVHAFGEMVAVLCSRGLYNAAVRLEELWNSLARECRFALFCAYPWQQFSRVGDAAAFQRICFAHDHVCPSTQALEKSNPDVSRQLAILQQENHALRCEVVRGREAEATLQNRERELMDFLENAAEALHRVGPDGTILWANKAELAMLGYRWDEYVGHHISEFHTDSDVIASILTRLQQGQTLLDEPARLNRRDASIQHVVISSNGCFENGRLRYTRCFTRDATERHLLVQLHREREVLVTKLSEANRAKDEFLAMLGHELRNPLAPVSAAAEVLKIVANDPERVQHVAGVIKRQVRHMTGLVDDLLDVARVTRGLIALDTSVLDLRAILTDAAEQIASRVQANNQSLQLDIPREPVLVMADRKRIVQVVANILVNANKFTPNGGTINMRLRADMGETELIVSDTGIGMDAELLAHVFDLFVQGRRTPDRAQGGLGLGLALARSLVELHGGSITAASKGIGMGSTFTVRLPQLSNDLGNADNERSGPKLVPILG
ncbi:ATP-binding protein [Massilia sp. CCM 8734]|uniref:ATP-binding protein n=1 Tax=Massilia sp. CCM 8734 TaxID=2609283 RepID=UPI0014210632|nr:ATP-binding protein [Massilia sp. CCM 8734]NHZ96418.1 PAS domain-containing protein [Massilia sp. CCM 8734]